MQTKVLAVFICLYFFSSLGMAQNYNKDRLPRLNNISVDFGPSFMYADNAGGTRIFRFKLQPATAISYGRKINSFLEIKGTVGFQMLKSQSPSYFSKNTINRWNETAQAFAMEGTAYHVDVMPVFHLLPYGIHIDRSDFNVYVGVGIGMARVDKEEVRITHEPMVENKSISIPYLPIRTGLSYSIGAHSDLAIEVGFLATFSDTIDGNEGYNRYNDHLFQTKLVFKRHLSNFPFWKK